MAKWSRVSKDVFDAHIKSITDTGENVHSRYFKRDDIIVFYTGSGNALDQQWIAKVHPTEGKKEYYTAPIPEQP